MYHERCVCEVYVSSVVDVNCSEGRRRARTKPGGTCFRNLFRQNLHQNTTLWDLLPVPVLVGLVKWRPSFSADEWLNNKKDPW